MVAAGVRVLLLVRLFHVVAVVFRVLSPGFVIFLLGLFVHFVLATLDTLVTENLHRYVTLAELCPERKLR